MSTNSLKIKINGRSSELLVFSVIVAVLVARSGLPVGSPPYILAIYPGIAPVGKGGTTWAYRDCTTARGDRKMAAVTHLGYTVI